MLHWVAAPPAQQIWPLAPQGEHIPIAPPGPAPSQARPVRQAFAAPPAQQGWPIMPQA
jgi:hypothetical protein